MSYKVRNKLSYLGDGEAIFKKWISWGKAGNVKMLSIWAGEEMGWKNPNTGRNPSGMGVWSRMWRWALRNPEKARPLYADYVLQFGELLDDEDWFSLLHERARVLLTHAGYKRYLAKYPNVALYSNR